MAGGLAGLMAGGVGMYASAIFNQVAKPPRPVANFAISAEGMTVTCQNHATGQSGWWDFGDGSPLEPYTSEQTNVPHTYTKPGNYAVKLIVRNFLMEENERSVPVDLSTTGTAATAAATGPAIPSFSVEPIGGVATAPATFRVRGEVRNADHVIWDLGTEQLEVGDSKGIFEKLVVFEKPGPYQVQLIGYNGKQAVKRAVQVNVSEARSGTFSAVVRVTDSGTQIDRKETTQTLTVPLPAKGATTIERAISVRPGHTIAEVRLGKVANPAMKSMRVEIAANKKTAKVIGEWAPTGKESSSQAGGGTDVLIPFTLVEERARPLPTSTETVATQFTPEGSFILANPTDTVISAMLPLPPVPTGMTDFKRLMQFEIREITPDKQMRVIGALPDLKPPFRATVNSSSGRPQVVDVQLIQNGQLRVTLTPAPTGRS